MTSVWRRPLEENYSPQAVKALAKEARISKCWIRYKESWFTPEELDAIAESRSFEEGRLFLRDPIAAIRAGKAYIETLQNKLSDFNIKVAEYYKNK